MAEHLRDAHDGAAALAAVSSITLADAVQELHSLSAAVFGICYAIQNADLNHDLEHVLSGLGTAGCVVSRRIDGVLATLTDGEAGGAAAAATGNP